MRDNLGIVSGPCTNFPTNFNEKEYTLKMKDSGIESSGVGVHAVVFLQRKTHAGPLQNYARVHQGGVGETC